MSFNMPNPAKTTCALCAVLLTSASVSASTAAAGAETARIDEIVVTARKKAESMYDVPISINVVSADAIDKLGAHDFTDLINSVPSLGAYQNGPGRTRLSIRGINSTSSSNGNDNDTQN